MSFFDYISAPFIRKALRLNRESHIDILTARDTIKALYNRAERFKKRLHTAKSKSNLENEVRIELALHSAELNPSANFVFRELLEHKIPKKYNWRLHPNSCPDRIFQVYQRKNGQLEKLAILIGFSFQRGFTHHLGHTAAVRRRLKLKKGHKPIFAVISAYVEKHNDAVVKAGRKKNLRGQIETAMIDLLFKAGFTAVQSSILFNGRENPLGGIMLNLRDPYNKYRRIILPSTYGYNEARRIRALTEKGFDIMKHEGNNATIWILYVNPAVTYVSKLPKQNLNQLLEPWDEVARKAIANKTINSKKIKLSFQEKNQVVQAYYCKVLNAINPTWAEKRKKESPRRKSPSPWFVPYVVYPSQILKASADEAAAQATKIAVNAAIKELKKTLRAENRQKQQAQIGATDRGQAPTVNQPVTMVNVPSSPLILQNSAF